MCPGVKVLVAGGDKINETSFYKNLQKANELGADGFAIGRNIWQSNEPLKIMKEVRRLKNENQKVTARKIKTSCGIDVNIRTIQRGLARLGFGYKNVVKKLPLTKRHIE
jgi:orotidine-5'-phosphate decarboxylase